MARKPTPFTITKMRRIHALACKGYQQGEAAELVGTTSRAITLLKSKYPDLAAEIWNGPPDLKLVEEIPTKEFKPVHSTVATEFHHSPKGDRARCPVCNCPPTIMLHRAVDPEENLGCKWIKRRKHPNGSTYDVLVPKPKTGHAHFSLTDQTKAWIRRTVVLMLKGKTFTAIAKELGVHRWDIIRWRSEHGAYWDECCEEAAKGAPEVARAALASGQIIGDNPEQHMAVMRAAEAVAQERGETLVPLSSKPTLRSFFHSHYLPLRGGSIKSECYLANFQTMLERWVAVTSDPPLENITVDHLVRFKAFLDGLKLGPASVARHLRILQQILDLAGPPMRGLRDGVGILDRVPYIKPPRVPRRLPRPVSIEAITAVYRAADKMTYPKGTGIPAPAWWRALLVTCWNTGLRRRTLFELELADIRWEAARLEIPPERMKSERGHVAPLNQVTMDHLLAIRTDRKLVFPWPHGSDHFFKVFRQLQEAAGIPKAERFGTHRLRKTFATNMWGVSPQAAQYGCGHADMGVTIQHYVAGTAIVADAVEKIPQPKAFTQG